MKRSLIILTLLVLLQCYLASRVTWEDEAKRLGSYQAAQLYHYPAPPVGKWKAIYTADFAKKFNLSSDGISSELKAPVSYIEIVSVPAPQIKYPNPAFAPDAGKPKQDCVVNVVAAKNNDFSLYSEDSEHGEKWVSNQIGKTEKPLQLFNLKKHPAIYLYISTISDHTNGAVYSSDLVPGYDYFSYTSDHCYRLVQSLAARHDYSTAPIPRASVFGMFVLDKSQRAKKENYNDSKRYQKIIIPISLLSSFYEGIEVPPEPASIGNIAQLGRLIMQIPQTLFMILIMAIDSAQIH